MEQKHAHEVLHMMNGNSYTEESLAQSIKDNFGEDQRFYACSAEGMDIPELIEFLKMKGKFMPAKEEEFTVDISKVCNH
ncbi:YecH family metal-binding protein [Dysgonomonas macrotermitis]|uniref:Probable metal-binding protein n=1 Tax=Dysgonomonas macrotermitis TaxID=1346286 RepID=A0A1M5C956_9BACT|nr:YecH family metal-binding protein [Dysgonomonas macrotermitis]SHF51137.1 probable metal-binding protein [Dysgonomonas macrotermitis]